MFYLRSVLHKENRHKAAIRVTISTTRLHKYIVTLVTISPDIYGINFNISKQTDPNY